MTPGIERVVDDSMTVFISLSMKLRSLNKPSQICCHLDMQLVPTHLGT
jgi:hypothetical protein